VTSVAASVASSPDVTTDTAPSASAPGTAPTGSTVITIDDHGGDDRSGSNSGSGSDNSGSGSSGSGHAGGDDD
jgi:hypothetical protein